MFSDTGIAVYWSYNSNYTDKTPKKMIGNMMEFGKLIKTTSPCLTPI
ncbi:hypothetical protein Leryth_004696 [Lithospermum erythrorhizon]|nr:hypothetical protein Leryth_004696 [Lithospermum erythrorhizon]